MTIEPVPERQPTLRVGDIERARTITDLQQAGLEGRLEPAELDERIARAQAARTETELAALLTDLPATTTPAPPERTVELRTGTGSIKRRGAWSVPRQLRVVTGTGGVRLDFTEADIPYQQIDIELRVGTGSIRLVLPPGATANIDEVHTGTGSVRSRVPGRASEAGPHFRVSGGTATGSVRVLYKRRWFRR